MTIKDSKETYLWPFNVKIHFVFWLKNIEDDWNPVFIIVSDDSLVGICSIRLDDSAFLLTGFCGFMVFKLDSFWVEWRWIFTEQKSLNFYKRYIWIFWFFWYWSRDLSQSSLLWAWNALRGCWETVNFGSAHWSGVDRSLPVHSRGTLKLSSGWRCLKSLGLFHTILLRRPTHFFCCITVRWILP